MSFGIEKSSSFSQDFNGCRMGVAKFAASLFSTISTFFYSFFANSSCLELLFFCSEFSIQLQKIILKNYYDK
jgi:hypothetical protein